MFVDSVNSDFLFVIKFRVSDIQTFVVALSIFLDIPQAQCRAQSDNCLNLLVGVYRSRFCCFLSSEYQ